MMSGTDNNDLEALHRFFCDAEADLELSSRLKELAQELQNALKAVQLRQQQGDDL